MQGKVYVVFGCHETEDQYGTSHLYMVTTDKSKAVERLKEEYESSLKELECEGVNVNEYWIEDDGTEAHIRCGDCVYREEFYIREMDVR